MVRHALLLLSFLLAASPSQAATLAQALEHWTGMPVDVIGAGADVRIALPRSSPIPELRAQATPGARGGDPGWALTRITVPQPSRLRDGDVLTLAAQHAQAWLGARTAQAAGDYDGIAIAHHGEITRFDHAHIALTSTGGPVSLLAEVTGLHLPPSSGDATLVPQHALLRGHTTPEGAAALTDLAAGGTRPVPITIDSAHLDVGATQFDMTGAVTLRGPDDRQGQLTVTVNHFKELLNALPQNGAGARAYPILMILREVGEKHGSLISWTIVFSGRQVLVDGIDIGVLFGGK